MGTALTTVCLVHAVALLWVLAAPPLVKKQISHDWSDVAGEHFLAFCTDVKSFVRRFSAQDVTFVVLSFLCVKVLAISGVPRAAVVLLALLAGTFCSFFGFFSKPALCEAEMIASSV